MRTPRPENEAFLDGSDIPAGHHFSGSGAPELSAGSTLRFDASADDRPHRSPRHGTASRDRIIDARPLSVITAGPSDTRRGFASTLRRYAPAGLAATAAIALAFVGGNYLGASQSNAAAATAQAARHVPPPAPVVLKDPETTRQMAQMATDVRLLSARVETLRATVEGRQSDDHERALKKSIDALRSGVEQSKLDTSKALGQMAQKLERLQHEPSAKLAQITERIDHIERRAANDVTGSIGKPVALSAAAAPAPKPVATVVPQPKPAELTKPTEAPKPIKAVAALPGPKLIVPTAVPEPKPQPKVIPGYVLRDMEGDVAIIEGHGQIFELINGDTVPGIGRVEGIERRGREWVVVTSRGIITSRPRN